MHFNVSYIQYFGNSHVHSMCDAFPSVHTHTHTRNISFMTLKLHANLNTVHQVIKYGPMTEEKKRQHGGTGKCINYQLRDQSLICIIFFFMKEYY